MIIHELCLTRSMGNLLVNVALSVAFCWVTGMHQTQTDRRTAMHNVAS